MHVIRGAADTLTTHAHTATHCNTLQQIGILTMLCMLYVVLLASVPIAFNIASVFVLLGASVMITDTSEKPVSAAAPVPSGSYLFLSCTLSRLLPFLERECICMCTLSLSIVYTLSVTLSFYLVHSL